MRKNKYVLHAVKKSVKEKIDVVQKDEKESGETPLIPTLILETLNFRTL